MTEGNAVNATATKTAGKTSSEDQAAATAAKVKAKVAAKPRIELGEKVPVKDLTVGTNVVFLTKRGKKKLCEVVPVSKAKVEEIDPDGKQDGETILKTKTRRGARLVVGLRTKSGSTWDHYASPREQINLQVDSAEDEPVEDKAAEAA